MPTVSCLLKTKCVQLRFCSSIFYFGKMGFCSFSLLVLQSLVDIVNKIKHMSNGRKPEFVIRSDSTIISRQGGLDRAEKPFDAMNNIVANLLLNITRYNITTFYFCFVIHVGLGFSLSLSLPFCFETFLLCFTSSIIRFLCRPFSSEEM